MKARHSEMSCLEGARRQIPPVTDSALKGILLSLSIFTSGPQGCQTAGSWCACLAPAPVWVEHGTPRLSFLCLARRPA